MAIFNPYFHHFGFIEIAIPTIFKFKNLAELYVKISIGEARMYYGLDGFQEAISKVSPIYRHHRCFYMALGIISDLLNCRTQIHDVKSSP